MSAPAVQHLAGRVPSLFVYFVQSGPDGPIKIGSASNVAARVRALQIGCPDRLRVLAVLTGGLRKEHELHERFAESRKEGEWFWPAAGIGQYLALMARGDRDGFGIFDSRLVAAEATATAWDLNRIELSQHRSNLLVLLRAAELSLALGEWVDPRRTADLHRWSASMAIVLQALNAHPDCDTAGAAWLAAGHSLDEIDLSA